MICRHCWTTWVSMYLQHNVMLAAKFGHAQFNYIHLATSSISLFKIIKFIQQEITTTKNSVKISLQQHSSHKKVTIVRFIWGVWDNIHDWASSSSNNRNKRCGYKIIKSKMSFYSYFYIFVAIRITCVNTCALRSCLLEQIQASG